MMKLFGVRKGLREKIERLESTVKGKDAAIAKLRDDIDEKDHIIIGVAGTVTDLRTDNKSLVDENAKLKIRNVFLESK